MYWWTRFPSDSHNLPIPTPFSFAPFSIWHNSLWWQSLPFIRQLMVPVTFNFSDNLPFLRVTTNFFYFLQSSLLSTSFFPHPSFHILSSFDNILCFRKPSLPFDNLFFFRQLYLLLTTSLSRQPSLLLTTFRSSKIFLLPTTFTTSKNLPYFRRPSQSPYPTNTSPLLMAWLSINLFFPTAQGFGAGTGAGAARSRGIWLEPEPSLWPGSGSTLNICLIIHANYIELDLIWWLQAKKEGSGRLRLGNNDSNTNLFLNLCSSHLFSSYITPCQSCGSTVIFLGSGSSCYPQCGYGSSCFIYADLDPA